MASVGARIYYDQHGQPVWVSGEAQGDIREREEEQISYIDLPYGDKTLENAAEWHVEHGQIVVDAYQPERIDYQAQADALALELLAAKGVI